MKVEGKVCGMVNWLKGWTASGRCPAQPYNHLTFQPFDPTTYALAVSDAQNIVYFDLETKKSFEEVGGRNGIRRLGMSLGVTYSTASGEYKIYGENDAVPLSEELLRADLVVGYNVIGFDFVVLQGENEFFDFEQVCSLDMMVDVADKVEFRPPLDAIAHGSLGIEKTAEGLQAVKWYREGKLMEIAEYCCYDVKITKLVHEYGRAKKQVQFKNRLGVDMSVPVEW